MAKFIDISSWNELSWYNTGGTRAKKFIQSPEGEYFYFKRSQFKPATTNKLGKDFKYEFWSEIIAHEVGKELGFNVLRYDIAFDGQNMGCISKSMFNSESQHFIEGIRLLQGYDPNYDPENKAHRNLYNFQAIESALEKFVMARFNKNIVETIVFDAIIGNGDRHQENWAIIMDHSAIPNAIDKLQRMSLQNLKIDRNLIYDDNSIIFAPIYDSGSSLGRELTDDRINELLKSDLILDSYIKRGLSEIHWRNIKVSHYVLIQKLLEGPHNSLIVNILKRVFAKNYSSFIGEIIERVDIELPEFLKDHKIPTQRKEFIGKLIVARIDELKKLVNA